MTSDADSDRESDLSVTDPVRQALQAALAEPPALRTSLARSVTLRMQAEERTRKLRARRGVFQNPATTVLTVTLVLCAFTAAAVALYSTLVP
jgi:hypothetical protein